MAWRPRTGAAPGRQAQVDFAQFRAVFVEEPGAGRT